MTTPRVSVVIPFYRGTRTLARAIDSIQAQTVLPAEIIVVDDGSPDSIPDSIGDASVPVRRLRHAVNRGIPAARNTGVRAATGEWVAFLDQDDEWRPWKLEEQLVVARSARPDDVIYSRCDFAGEGDPRAGASLPPRGCAPDLAAGGPRALRRLLRRGNVVPFITIMMRRDALLAAGGLDESYVGGTDDAELMLRLASRGSRFLLASPAGRSAAVHWFTGANYSDPARWIDEESRALRALAAADRSLAREAEVGLARSHFRYARHLARRGEKLQAREHYAHAARLDPRWMKPRAALVLAALGL